MRCKVHYWNAAHYNYLSYKPSYIPPSGPGDLPYTYLKYLDMRITVCGLFLAADRQDSWHLYLPTVLRLAPGYGQTIHHSPSTTLSFCESASYALIIWGTQLPLNNIATVCCPGSTTITDWKLERVFRLHLVKKNPKNYPFSIFSRIVLNVALEATEHIWWSLMYLHYSVCLYPHGWVILF